MLTPIIEIAIVAIALINIAALVIIYRFDKLR